MPMFNTIYVKIRFAVYLTCMYNIAYAKWETYLYLFSAETHQTLIAMYNGARHL